MEEWRDIDGYEGLYQVSNLGNVRSFYSNKTLKGGTDLGGYKIVSLRKNMTQKTKTVHRLVATAFIPNPDNLPCINHIDENKNNNSVNNLEWCTHQYNNTYGTFTERRIKKRYKVVRQYDMDGNFIKEYTGLVNAQKETGINRNNITSVAKGKRNHAGGYKWTIK
jgi:hypothetical protein